MLSSTLHVTSAQRYPAWDFTYVAGCVFKAGRTALFRNALLLYADKASERILFLDLGWGKWEWSAAFPWIWRAWCWLLKIGQDKSCSFCLASGILVPRLCLLERLFSVATRGKSMSHMEGRRCIQWSTVWTSGHLCHASTLALTFFKQCSRHNGTETADISASCQVLRLLVSDLNSRQKTMMICAYRLEWKQKKTGSINITSLLTFRSPTPFSFFCQYFLKLHPNLFWKEFGSAPGNPTQVTLYPHLAWTLWLGKGDFRNLMNR